MGKGYRQGRLGEEIRKITSDMIFRELKDPRLKDSMTSVTAVEVTSDASYATIYLSVFKQGADETEMAELKEIHDRMQEKGCGIVGLEFEGETWDDEIKQASKAVFEENGITYPNVIIPQDLAEQLRGFPTTFFVDKEGTILCMPIVGADVESYERILDSLLEGETVMDVTTSTAEEMAETQTAVYNVRVSDENGPVKDVIIQFCSSASCSMGQTDENGVASFSMPAGEVYDIHVLQAPDAYEKDTETYHTTDESSDVEIQLKKK